MTIYNCAQPAAYGFDDQIAVGALVEWASGRAWPVQAYRVWSTVPADSGWEVTSAKYRIAHSTDGVVQPVGAPADCGDRMGWIRERFPQHADEVARRVAEPARRDAEAEAFRRSLCDT